ncbi:MAG: phosphomannomutase [Streptosporangiaceae bacterium]|nr:phosphomannomutase [Streptosporangiaceae bacterium]
MIPADLQARVQAWIAEDPDPGDRAELRALLTDSTGTDERSRAAGAELADRFVGRLEFGTAGLRGAVGAGPNRMNRAVVRATTAALAGWLRQRRPGAAKAGVVVGWDARHRSAEFAEEVTSVLSGAGFRVHLMPGRCPTPLLAFGVRHLSAAAGVMITASHNPPADNGYKLYLGDGAQIVPPADVQIAAAIRALGPLSQIPAGPATNQLVIHHGDEVAQAYLDAIAGNYPEAEGTPASAPLGVVYTPLHGVAGRLALRAFARAGFQPPHVVAAQAEPDPDFPTVTFPNPEQPGVLDLALGDARTRGADLVLANDPDGDRLAVAVPDPLADDGWRMLTGDQVGALLGADLIEEAAAAIPARDQLVATTVVSSTMLSKIAAAAGARYVETLTGFKWIVRAGEYAPDSHFVFGYEEALGYAIGDTVRDKDGISAALAVLALLARARPAGLSLLDRWDALEATHGVHLTAQLTAASRHPADVMNALRRDPPAALGGQPVISSADLAVGSAGLPPADVLRYWLADARVVIRPSGTEPKLKAYLEIVERTAGRSLAAARAAAAARLAALRPAVVALITAEFSP